MKRKTPSDLAAGHLWHCVDKELGRMSMKTLEADEIFACALISLIAAGQEKGLDGSAVMKGVIGAMVVEAYDSAIGVDELVAAISANVREAYALNVASERLGAPMGAA